MASFNQDPSLLTTILRRLEPLQGNDYVLAFGPQGKQFLATPNGYAATYLPHRILAELANGEVRTVLWASFGDKKESWFFVYQNARGKISIRLGDEAPQALHDYIKHIAKSSEDLLSFLRVQLGDNGSFVVWTKTAWACYNVPETLLYRLCQLSGANQEHNGLTKGSFQNTTITNLAWHQDGSCFLQTLNDRIGWVFSTAMMDDAWQKLWGATGVPGLSREQANDLAYVAIDAHAPMSTTFVFIKKQKPVVDAEYIFHIADDLVYCKLAQSDRRVQVFNAIPSGYFGWAISKRAGRSHADGWEVELKKGQKVKVWREMGHDWYLVETKKGIKGYCHGSWLDFGDSRLQEDPSIAYKKFMWELGTMMKSGPIKKFPSMMSFVGVCTVGGCRPAEVLPGVCVHNLEELLRGSGLYSVEFLKKGRLCWHPDKFARVCDAAASEELKAKAEQLFKLYGICLEEEEKRAGGSQ